MGIPQEDLDRILERANIVEFIGDYVRLEQRGNRYWGLSPFKQEKTPSFCVDPEKGMYYCFSTHQGGNLYTFLMQVGHLSFPEAVETIAKRYGLTYRRSGVATDSQYHVERKALLELYARITNSFHYLLQHTAEAAAARRYLQRRGITEKTIADFRLGYCPRNGARLRQFLLDKGYDRALLAKSGLFHATRSARALFAGRILFPITNRLDEVVAFGARAVDDSQPKYVNSPETVLFQKRNELFGQIRTIMRDSNNIDEAELYLVEGYMDVLALHQLGVTHVAAALGTAFSAEQARALSRIAKRIVLLFDSDEAGRRATIRAAGILQQMELEPQACALPDQLDPAEMMQTDHDFKKNCRQTLVMHTKSMIEYLLRIEFSEGTLHSSTQSDSALKRIFGYISLTSTVLKRELCIQQVADYLNIDRSTLLQDFDAWSRRQRERSSSSAHPAAGAQPSDSHRSAARFEIDCMITSICCPDEFPYLRAVIDAQCFENQRARYLFELQEQAFQQHTTSSQEIIEMIAHPKLKDYVIRTLIDSETVNCKQTIADIAHRLKKRALVRNRAQQIALLRTLERDVVLDHKSVENVQLEIMYLNKEILKQ